MAKATYKSHMKRKENDLNQTSMIMVHVNLDGCNMKNVDGFCSVDLLKNPSDEVLQLHFGKTL